MLRAIGYLSVPPSSRIRRHQQQTLFEYCLRVRNALHLVTLRQV
jgi:hypothetical protein